MTGIDVRRHNGTIAWKSVKEDFFLAAVYVKHSGVILAMQNGG